MRVLLDTHAIIWFTDGDARLPDTAIEIIKDPGNDIYVSIASIWEIAIKTSLGKLTVSRSIDGLYHFMQVNKINVLQITPAHLNILSTLPHHHRDPFDRLLIAQAISEGFSIVSADQHFNAYEAKIIWE